MENFTFILSGPGFVIMVTRPQNIPLLSYLSNYGAKYKFFYNNKQIQPGDTPVSLNMSDNASVDASM